MQVTIRGKRGSATLRPTLMQRLLGLLALFLAPVAAYAERLFVLWANHKGSEGTVKFTSAAIAELRSWTLSMTGEVIEDTTLTDAAKTFQAGNTAWSGSFSCFWDETDTSGQMAGTVGASVTLNMYPEGDTSGDTYYTGTAIITGNNLSAAINGMVEAEYTFQGTGALTKTTVGA
jgi:hypothetical protein